MSMAIHRAKSLLHNERFNGIEGDDEIVLLHVIADLLEWCDEHRMDFAATVESAQQMLRETS